MTNPLKVAVLVCLELIALGWIITVSLREGLLVGLGLIAVACALFWYVGKALKNKEKEQDPSNNGMKTDQ